MDEEEDADDDVQAAPARGKKYRRLEVLDDEEASMASTLGSIRATAHTPDPEAQSHLVRSSPSLDSSPRDIGPMQDPNFKSDDEDEEEESQDPLGPYYVQGPCDPCSQEPDDGSVELFDTNGV
jgi:hypothetical protein